MENLDKKDWSMLAIQAGIELVPVIGGSISTMIFGTIQERKAKTMETFVNQLKNDVEAIKDKIVDNNNQLYLTELTGDILAKVADEVTDRKLKYFKEAFLNNFTTMIDDDVYTNHKFFIYTLANMSVYDLEVIASLYELKLEKMGISGSQCELNILASCEKLRTSGLASGFMNSGIKPSVNWSEITTFTISKLGEEFVEFCISNTPESE